MDVLASPPVPPVGSDTMLGAFRFRFEAVIDDICRQEWEKIGVDEVMQVAKAYYYFSVQFRENLEIACLLYPHDQNLRKLQEGECNTDNLSPWPGIAVAGERLDHDEFVARLLLRQEVSSAEYLTLIGQAYLDRVRDFDHLSRATSLASYEDGGLTRVFQAILRARNWRGAGASAFKFFLEQHIRFDADDGIGHGALSRHLPVNDDVLPLWIAFRELLVAAVPRFWWRPDGSLRLVQSYQKLSLSAEAVASVAPPGQYPVRHEPGTDAKLSSD